MKKLILFLALMGFAANAYAVPAIIIGVAVGAGAFAVGATVFTAIAVGMAAASFYMAQTFEVPTSKTQSQMKQMLRSSRPPKQVVYGRTMISGSLIFAEEQVGDQENDEGTYDEWLYMAMGVTGHGIQEVHNIYLNETPISEFGDKVNYQLHNNPTVVDSYLLANAPSWKDDMIGRNTTWLRLGLHFDRKLFSNGVPTPKLEFSGSNEIWDPRDGSTGYTNNAALVILDYFLKYHRGMTRDRIITSGYGSFIDAANLCDELVTNPDGSTSKRYTVNGVFNLDEKPSNVLEGLLAACGGQLVRINGNIGLLPAAYYGPATFTLTDSDVIGGVQMQPENSYSQSVNTVKGTFIDPSQSYSEVDYPNVVDQDTLTRDGGEKSSDLNLRFVTDVYQAQRLADIQLKRTITGGNISIRTNLKGMYARLGRVVTLNLESLNIVGEYRVLKCSAALDGGVDLSLARDTSAIYNDAAGESFTPPPLTNLPTGGVQPPEAVQFLVEAVGETVQGFVSWTNKDPQTATTDVRIKRQDTGAIVLQDNVNGSSYKVSGLVVNTYIAEVRTVNARGKVSTWQAASFTVGIPPAPTSVELKRSNWNIQLIPNISSGIPTGTLFQFRYLDDPNSFLTQPPSRTEDDINISEELFIGSSFNHGGLTPDRWHHYWVRSVSVYGQSAWTYVQTGTTREQDLVTTVVERLEAIEIVSSNYAAGSSGYKIFGPQDPDKNGDVEFNSGTFRGDIVAKTLTLTGSIPSEIDNNQITKGQLTSGGKIYPDQSATLIKSSNYVSGSQGWAIDTYGNCEFASGTFRGTVYAQRMIGDVYIKTAREGMAVNNTWYYWSLTGRGFTRTLEWAPTASVGRVTVQLETGQNTGVFYTIDEQVGIPVDAYYVTLPAHWDTRRIRISSATTSGSYGVRLTMYRNDNPDLRPI